MLETVTPVTGTKHTALQWLHQLRSTCSPHSETSRVSSSMYRLTMGSHLMETLSRYKGLHLASNIQRTSSKMSVVFPGPSHHWKLQRPILTGRRTWGGVGGPGNTQENQRTFLHRFSVQIQPFTVTHCKNQSGVSVCLYVYITRHVQKGRWHGCQSEAGTRGLTDLAGTSGK